MRVRPWNSPGLALDETMTDAANLLVDHGWYVEMPRPKSDPPPFDSYVRDEVHAIATRLGWPGGTNPLEWPGVCIIEATDRAKQAWLRKHPGKPIQIGTV